MGPSPAFNEVVEINAILVKICPWSELKTLTNRKESLGHDIVLPEFRKALKELTGEEDYERIDENKLKIHPDSLFSMMKKKKI